VRFEDVERVEFRGGFFLRPFRAEVIGDDFEIRYGYEGKEGKTRRRRKARLNAEVLRLHPRLLERLIQMGEQQGDSPLCREGLENAKFRLRDWMQTTPEALPLEPWDETALGAGEEFA
jgi:hypothetical protein